jgi:hypothetical protein
MGTKAAPILTITIPPGWISKPEALKRSNRSLKRFEQTIRREAIETRYTTNPGKRPMPIYRIEDIDRITKRGPQPGAMILSQQALVARPPKPAPPAPAAAPPDISIDRMHLVSMKQAQKLGYPRELLRRWKGEAGDPNAPGVWYGKKSFKFSVAALHKIFA